MKIRVIVPQKEKGKWKVSMFNSHGKQRSNVNTLFSLIERRLLASELKEKTAIVVKYGKDTFNESLSSVDARYLLYTLGCFLEDYLSAERMGRIEKTYAK